MMNPIKHVSIKKMPEFYKLQNFSTADSEECHLACENGTRLWKMENGYRKLSVRSHAGTVLTVFLSSLFFVFPSAIVGTSTNYLARRVKIQEYKKGAARSHVVSGYLIRHLKNKCLKKIAHCYVPFIISIVHHIF